MKNKLHSIHLIIFCIFAISGCDTGNSDSGGDDESFELAGTWFADDAQISEGVDGDLTFTLSDTTFTNSVVIGTETYNASGVMISFSNEENWYIAQVTEGGGSENGQYGRTDYTLADDGLSFTGTSYSYEDTAEAALASTTPQMENITAVKQ